MIQLRYVDPVRVVQQHLKNNPIPQWEIAIMCFHSKHKTHIIADRFHAKLLGYRIFSKCDENVVYQAEIEGKFIGILGWCTGGGPLVASLIEELAAIGVKYIIGIGAAASITKNISVQEIVLATELLVNDGTSKCYIADRPVIHIHPQMEQLFRVAANEFNLQIREVKAATIEALYRQDDKLLQPWRNNGCEIVNWELTPLYAASETCGIKCLWFGHISDVEVDGRWNDWYCNREHGFNNCIELCKKVMQHLVRYASHEN